VSKSIASYVSRNPDSYISETNVVILYSLILIVVLSPILRTLFKRKNYFSTVNNTVVVYIVAGLFFLVDFIYTKFYYFYVIYIYSLFSELFFGELGLPYLVLFIVVIMIALLIWLSRYKLKHKVVSDFPKNRNVNT